MNTLTVGSSPRTNSSAALVISVTDPTPGVGTEDVLEDLLVEDAEVEVRAYPGVVRAGIGATVWAHPGVTVDAVDGAVVYLAPGASLEESRSGAVERVDISVISWNPTQTDQPSSHHHQQHEQHRPNATPARARQETPMTDPTHVLGKTCSNCQQHQPWRAFGRDRHQPGGRRPRCLTCEGTAPGRPAHPAPHRLGRTDA